MRADLSASKREATKTKDEQVIKEIIDRYGEEIHLKKTAHLIIEIIRQYAGRVGGSAHAECLPPGGPPDKEV